MVQYICERCSKTFIRKTEYTRHINRKFPCKNNTTHNKQDDQKGKINNNELIETIKGFATEIKELREKEVENTATIKELKEKYMENTATIKELKEMVKELKNKDTYTFNQYNINLIAYGNEDLSFITDADKKRLVMAGFECIPKYIEMVHCNDTKPENKNIYIGSKKSMNKVMVYDGKKWKLRASRNVLDELYNKGIDYVEGQFDELKEQGKIPNGAIRRLERIFQQMTENDKDNKQKINDEIKLILYNNRP